MIKSKIKHLDDVKPCYNLYSTIRNGVYTFYYSRGDLSQFYYHNNMLEGEDLQYYKTMLNDKI